MVVEDLGVKRELNVKTSTWLDIVHDRKQEKAKMESGFSLDFGEQEKEVVKRVRKPKNEKLVKKEEPLKQEKPAKKDDLQDLGE